MKKPIRWQHGRAELELLLAIKRTCERSENGVCYKANDTLAAELARTKGKPKPFSERQITTLRARLIRAGLIESLFTGPHHLPMWTLTPKGERQAAWFMKDKGQRIAPRQVRKPRLKRKRKSARERARVRRANQRARSIATTLQKRVTPQKASTYGTATPLLSTGAFLVCEYQPAFDVEPIRTRARAIPHAQPTMTHMHPFSLPAQRSFMAYWNRHAPPRSVSTHLDRTHPDYWRRIGEQAVPKPVVTDEVGKVNLEDDNALWEKRGGNVNVKRGSVAHAPNSETPRQTSGALNDPWRDRSPASQMVRGESPTVRVHGDFPNAPASRRGAFDPAEERKKLIEVSKIPSHIVDKAFDELARRQAFKFGDPIHRPDVVLRSIALEFWTQERAITKNAEAAKKRADEAVKASQDSIATTSAEKCGNFWAQMRAGLMLGTMPTFGPTQPEPPAPTKPTVAFTAAAARAEPEEREGELVVPPPPIATQLADAMRINKPPAPVVTSASIGMPTKKPLRPIDRPPPDVTERDWIAQWDATPLAILALRKGHTVDSLARATGYDAVRLAKVATYWLRPAGRLLGQLMVTLAGDDARAMETVHETLRNTMAMHRESRNPETDRG